MEKATKKKLAFLLAAVLAFSLIISGCSKSDGSASSDAVPLGSTGSTASGTSFKIGVNTWGSGVPILDSFGDDAEYSFKILGNTTSRASDDFTSEKELQNIQNFCAAGVDGICMTGCAISTVPQMAQTCKDAKIPFVLYVFIGNDDDRDNIAKTNDYYAGAVDSAMVYDGEVMAQKAYDSGCRKAVLIGGNIGDNNMDQRSEGFNNKFKELGGEVLSEARCTDASECATKAEDMLSANKDADCLYAMVGDYIPGSISAIDNLGLTDKIKVFLSCVDATSAQYIKDGRIVAGNDGITLAAYIAPTLLLNYLDGHKIVDEDGLAPRFRTKPFTITADNVDSYMSIFCTDGVYPVTEDMLKSLCYRCNPDVTYQTYVDFIDNLNLDTLLKAHGLAAAD